MQKKFKNKEIYDDSEQKEKSPIIPIVIVIAVAIVLCVIVFFGLSLLAEHTELEVPWSIGDKNKKNPTGSSRDQMGLVIPQISGAVEPKEFLEAEMEITSIKKDKYGFLIKLTLTTFKSKYTTISVKQVNLDGFYFTPTFELSDPIDINDDGSWKPRNSQEGTTYDIRIKKTELDAIDMFGFNNLKLIFDAENEEEEMINQEYYVQFNNDLDIVNERKGLLKIDEKANVEISYYKTIAAADGTYIYFDFKNKNNNQDIKVYVKQLTINNKIYDISSFEGISNRSSQKSLFLYIPKKSIERVNTMKVELMLVKEDEKTKEKSFYITNEYKRVY